MRVALILAGFITITDGHVEIVKRKLRPSGELMHEAIGVIRGLNGQQVRNLVSNAPKTIGWESLASLVQVGAAATLCAVGGNYGIRARNRVLPAAEVSRSHLIAEHIVPRSDGLGNLGGYLPAIC